MNISNAIITTPFDHHTDFTELASNCENYCETMVEATEPVPTHLVDYLTVDSHPLHEPSFNPETDELCRYCEEITHLLISGALAPHSARVMEDLLLELTTFFADILKAPRWLRTDSGLNPLN